MHIRIGFLIILVLTACGQESATAVPASSPMPPAAVTPASDADNISAAQTLIEQLARGDWPAATAKFDTTMAAALPADKLEQVWTGIVSQLGAFQSAGEPTTGSETSYRFVDLPLQFANGAVNAHVVFDAAGLIAGLFFKPQEPSSPPGGADLPAYVDAASFTEEPITVGAATQWPLSGTLSLPNGAGPFPAVILVHGSGPSDRDETIGPNRPFRDLAGGLASQGVAVLRFDKRTLIYGRELQALPGMTVRDESIDDALAAAQLLRSDSRIDPARIFGLGHSLGGTLAPRIGEADPQLAGLIIMAGATTPLEDLLLDQYTYIFNLDGSVDAQEQAQLDALMPQIAQIKSPALSAATPLSATLGVPASYWLDLRGYDPAALARDITQPLLIMQGERDYQVPLSDFAHWQAQLADNPRASFKQYPELNHLFMAGEGPATPDEYQQPGHVDARVIADIGAFIQAH